MENNEQLKGMAIKITLIYTIVGGLWILFSDKLLSLLIKDAATLTVLQTFKGWFYVVATAAMLNYIILQNLKIIDRTQKAQLESEKRYRSLFNNSPTSIIMLDPKSGQIIDANPAAVGYFQIKREELTKNTIYDILSIPESLIVNLMQENRWVERRELLLDTGRKGDIPGVIEIYGGRIKTLGEELLCLNIRDISAGRAALEAAAAKE